MSSTSQLIEAPWPQRLNSDIAPSLLGPDETPVLKNIKTRLLPNEVRPRNGIVYVTHWANADDGGTGTAIFKDAPDTWIPYHAFFGPDGRSLVIGLVNQTGALSPAWPFYYKVQDAIEGSAANQAGSGAYVGTDTNLQFPVAKPGAGGYGVAPASFGAVYLKVYPPVYSPRGSVHKSTNWRALHEGVNFWGQPVQYDGCTFFCQADNFGPLSDGWYPNSKYFDSTTSEDSLYITNRTRIVQWGGAYAGTQNKALTYQGSLSLSAATNASTSATFSTSPSVSRKGHLVVLTGTPVTNGMTNPAYTWLYRVKAHTASTATVTFDRPYGIGETTTYVPTLTGTVTVSDSPSQTLFGSPGGVGCVAVFRERLFGARAMLSTALTSGGPQAWPSPIGEYGGDYQNALVWSKPGNPQRWPDQNFVVVGEDEPIMCLATIGEQLVIFKESRMFVLTGYDEDSFQVTKVSDIVGCPYPNAYTVHEGILYFANQDGIYAYDGTNLSSLSEPAPGHGISTLWNTRYYARAYGQGPQYFWPTLAVTPDSHLVVCCQWPFGSSSYADNFVYDIKNRAWSEWGLSDPTLNPVRVVQSPDGRVYAIHRFFVSDITDLWNPAISEPAYDTYINTAASYAETATAIIPEIELWVNATPGKTFRVKEMQIDHRCFYSYSDSTPSYTPWTIKFATDPDLVLGSTEHSIAARQGTSYNATDPRHYSDRLPETYQREAQTLRVKFTGNTYLDANLRMKEWTLLRTRFLIDQMRNMGVDNSTV